MLRRRFGIEHTDSEADVIQRIDDAVLPLGDELQSALPYVRYLLAVDPGKPTVTAMDARLRRTEIFDAMRRYFLTAAQTHPLVLVFEDLHWMDAVTEEFLRFFLESRRLGKSSCC